MVPSPTVPLPFLGALLIALGSCSQIAGLPDVMQARQPVAPHGAGALAFSVIGDLPYNEDQKFALDRYISPKLADDDDLSFVIHLGDFKAGRKSPCASELLEGHKEWMGSLGHPVFYTPGDNEWTDCDRETNAPPVSSLTQLQAIRDTLFLPPPNMPAELGVAWQPEAPENAIWSTDKVVFATLHISGSNNGRNEGKPCSRGEDALCDGTEALVADAAAREAHAVTWVRYVYSRARLEAAEAVVIATHADLTAGNRAAGPCTQAEPIKCNAYLPMLKEIVAGARTYGKPVMFVHGDTSPYCWERGFGGADNLWRLNSAGDFVLIDAVKVTVEPESKEPFQAVGVQSGLTPGAC